METLELFQRLSVALAIGLLIGLERGWHLRGEADGERAVGLRTLALGGLLGGVWGALAQSAGPGNAGGGAIALALAFAVFSGAVVLFRYRDAAHDGTFGMTTVVAAMLAFALGSYAVMGDMRVAGAFGVATAALLALKPALHAWVRQMSWVELRSGLVLSAMTFIALPLLPNRTIDPWGAINPFELWLMTVLIAAISFAGYAAIKTLGAQRGILFGGIAGGLASSTAVTLTNARLAKLHPEQRDPLIGGALIAGATMVARVLIIAGALNRGLLALLAVPLGLIAVVLAGAGLWLLRRPTSGAQGGAEEALALTNPFDLATVLKFGALLTLISLLAKAATTYAGSAGVYALAAVSGIADVDAITLSMARLGGADLAIGVAARAIALAVAVNTVSKAVLGWGAGGPEAGKRLMTVSVLALAAGAAGTLIQALI